MIKELQSLGLSVDLLGGDDQPVLEESSIDSEAVDTVDDLFSQEIQEILEPTSMIDEAVIETEDLTNDSDEDEGGSDLFDTTDEIAQKDEGEESEDDTDAGI